MDGTPLSCNREKDEGRTRGSEEPAEDTADDERAEVSGDTADDGKDEDELSSDTPVVAPVRWAGYRQTTDGRGSGHLEME